MGCDIHLHIEIKVEGKWRHYNHPNIHRNYALFTKMAGVRDQEKVEPIALPRGIPEDAAFTTRLDFDHWGIDGHSHSYLDSAEIAELQEWIANQEWAQAEEPFWFEHTFGFLFGTALWGFNKYPDDRPKFLEDVRFVFWFDN